MPAATFDRDATAAAYARRHRAADPAVREIHYLPTAAPPNEIRLVEVNEAITSGGAPEPIDFGVDSGSPNEHKLIVLDVTPGAVSRKSGKRALGSARRLDAGGGCLDVSQGRSRRRK